MTASVPEITDVRGGLLAVQTEDLKRLGGELGDVCWQLTRWSGTEAIGMLEPELVASMALSPVTYVDAERALVRAMSHLAVAAVEWGALAVTTEAVGQWFGGGEDHVEQMLDDQLGKLLGKGVRLQPELALLGALGVAGPCAVWWATSTSQERAAARTRAEQFVTQHPDFVRHLAGGIDGFIEGFTGWRTPPGDVAAAGLAAQIYLDEGEALVEAGHQSVPDGRQQPTTVTDVVRHLRELSDLPESTGMIEIQSWRDESGQVRHVVYLPGTDDLNPFSSDTDMRDVEEDLRLTGGQHSAYLDGVEQVMRSAGIGATDPVMIAGHSLGGMVAVRELSKGHSFNVTNVITAGAPTAAEGALPATSRVLSLESSGDIVPQVEGKRNRISPQQTTVTFASGEVSIKGNHEPSTYERGAAAVDASHDKAVRAAVDAIQPFFTPGGSVSDQTFRISRAVTPGHG